MITIALFAGAHGSSADHTMLGAQGGINHRSNPFDIGFCIDVEQNMQISCITNKQLDEIGISLIQCLISEQKLCGN